jgi:hypothetical protein
MCIMYYLFTRFYDAAKIQKKLESEWRVNVALSILSGLGKGKRDAGEVNDCKSSTVLTTPFHSALLVTLPGIGV